MNRPTYCVYIVTNHARTLYIGVTNDLARRLYEHRAGLVPGFSRRYHVHQLVHYEAFRYVYDALRREKELKGWTRAKKVALIERENAGWVDLAVGLGLAGETTPPGRQLRGVRPLEGCTPPMINAEER